MSLPNYIKNVEKGYPKTVYWKVVAGKNLSWIQSYDLLYDEKDIKWLKKL